MPELAGGSLQMNTVAGQFLLQITVLIAEIAVHIDVKNTAAVSQSGDCPVSLYDGLVVVDRISAAHVFGDMHDALNIDDRIRLQLIDLLHNLAELFVIILCIGIASGCSLLIFSTTLRNSS